MPRAQDRDAGLLGLGPGGRASGRLCPEPVLQKPGLWHFGCTRTHCSLEEEAVCGLSPGPQLRVPPPQGNSGAGSCPTPAPRGTLSFLICGGRGGGGTWSRRSELNFENDTRGILQEGVAWLGGEQSSTKVFTTGHTWGWQCHPLPVGKGRTKLGLTGQRSQPQPPAPGSSSILSGRVADSPPKLLQLRDKGLCCPLLPGSIPCLRCEGFLPTPGSPAPLHRDGCGHQAQTSPLPGTLVTVLMLFKGHVFSLCLT